MEAGRPNRVYYEFRPFIRKARVTATEVEKGDKHWREVQGQD